MPKPIQEGEPGFVQKVNERFLRKRAKGKTLRERCLGVGTPIHPTVSVNKKKYENGQSQNRHHQKKKA